MYGGTSVESTKFWKIAKRFNDFVVLNNNLMESGLNLNFPKKKMVGNLGRFLEKYLCSFIYCMNHYLDRDFILKRQKELQDYISQILENTELASNVNTQTFFDPENYLINFQGR